MSKKAPEVVVDAWRRDAVPEQQIEFVRELLKKARTRIRELDKELTEARRKLKPKASK